jgi:hypothetical protein
MCALKELPPDALTRNAFPFNLNPMGKRHLPNQKVVMPGKRFKSCGLVSSSGRMSGSELGAIIGIHDIILKVSETKEGNESFLRRTHILAPRKI